MSLPPPIADFTRDPPAAALPPPIADPDREED